MTHQQDYKKNLEKWAARVGAIVTLKTETNDVYELGQKTGTQTFVVVECNLVHHQVKEEKNSQESLHDCEQRVSRKFLKQFAGTPIGRMN